MKVRTLIGVGAILTVSLVCLQVGSVLAGGPLAGLLTQPDGIPLKILSGTAAERSQTGMAGEAADAAAGLQNNMTQVDHSLAERWVLGAPNPGGEIPYGWFDVIGDEVFNTFQVDVTWSGTDVLIRILTNFPESGYEDGTAIGFPTGGFWQPADLAFDFDFDGAWDTGIALVDHGAIPADPSGTDPPGFGQTADSFVKGGIYDVTAWFSSDDIHYYHSGRGGRYDLSSPKIPIVWMRLGTKIGDAQVTWTALGGTDPAYQIDIVIKDVNASGAWDHFNLLWATANCANDVIIAGTEVVPDVVLNYLDGPIEVSSTTPVVATIRLDPGRYHGMDATWWLVARTPYAPPWYSYVSAIGWLSGFSPFQWVPLATLEPLEILDTVLSPGTFNFYFGVVTKLGGVPQRFFLDTASVTVADTAAP